MLPGGPKQGSPFFLHLSPHTSQTCPTGLGAHLSGTTVPTGTTTWVQSPAPQKGSWSQMHPVPLRCHWKPLFLRGATWGPHRVSPCPRGSPPTPGFSGPWAPAKSCITLTLRHPECEGWEGRGASTSQPLRSHLDSRNRPGRGSTRMASLCGQPVTQEHPQLLLEGSGNSDGYWHGAAACLTPTWPTPAPCRALLTACRSCSCPGLEAHQPPAGGASGAKEPGAHPRRELEGPSATPAATRHPSCASDPSLKQKMQEWTGAWLQSDVHSWACFTKAGIGTSMGLWLGKARAGYPASHLAAHGVDTLAGGVDTKPHWEAGRAGCRACCGDRGLCCYPPKAAALWPVWAPGDTSIHDLDQSSHEPNREALPPATFPRHSTRRPPGTAIHHAQNPALQVCPHRLLPVGSFP
uniref:uncharacterized protein LOC120887573 isoform X2 n=1 Tax=Ictidomys tridecemlineatus TaxID=43179 RepID=UPI001A9F44E3|nr:uncharacterized protein LOC120887573 isoform X2 [Ictidomys tridecemlineatus]